VAHDELEKEQDGRKIGNGGIRELAALGRRERSLGTEFPVLALNSVWRNPGNTGRYSPCLYSRDGRRGAKLFWLGHTLGPEWAFVIVQDVHAVLAPAS
jgi:hypothetical protein